MGPSDHRPEGQTECRGQDWPQGQVSESNSWAQVSCERGWEASKQWAKVILKGHTDNRNHGEFGAKKSVGMARQTLISCSRAARGKNLKLSPIINSYIMFQKASRFGARALTLPSLVGATTTGLMWVQQHWLWKLHMRAGSGCHSFSLGRICNYFYQSQLENKIWQSGIDFPLPGSLPPKRREFSKKPHAWELLWNKYSILWLDLSSEKVFLYLGAV